MISNSVDGSAAPQHEPSNSKSTTRQIIQNLLQPGPRPPELTMLDVWTPSSATPRIMSGVFFIYRQDDPRWAAIDDCLAGRRWEIYRKTEDVHSRSEPPFSVVLRVSTYRLKKLSSRENCGFIREIFTLPLKSSDSGSISHVQIAFVRQRQPRLYSHANQPRLAPQLAIPLQDPSAPPLQLMVETFELGFQPPLGAVAAESWIYLWRDSEAIDLWTLAPERRREWLGYLAEILFSLARWLCDQGGLIKCGQYLLTELRLRIPPVKWFPNRFDLLERDRSLILSLVAFLESKAYVRLRIPKRYCYFYPHVRSFPHWTGGVIEGRLTGIAAEGSIRLYDRLHIGTFMQTVPHGRGRTYSISEEGSILWSFSGEFRYGSRHGHGEELRQTETGVVVTIGKWENGELKTIDARWCQADYTVVQQPIPTLQNAVFVSTSNNDQPLLHKGNDDDDDDLITISHKTSADEVLDPFLLHSLNQPPLEEFPLFGNTDGGTNFEELFSA